MDRGEGVLVAEAIGAPPVDIDAAPASKGVARRRAGRLGRVAFVGFVFLILYGPLALLVMFSFNNSSIIALPWAGFTTKWYSQAFANGQLRSAVINSVVVAFIVAPLCLVLGTLTAFGLTRFRFRSRAMIGGLVGAPLILPWLVIGIAALLFYSSVQRLVLRVGLPNVFHLGLPTVVATQVICTFPLVTAIVSAQLFRFEKTQEEAAVDMGASRLQVLRYVILPHIAPALAAAAIFAFTWSFNNFEISFFTIGFQQTFPTWVYGTVRNVEHTAIVNSASTLISAIQVVMIYGALRLMRIRGGGVAGFAAITPTDTEKVVV